MTAFAEFGAATNFSFLRGASHPEEMVAMAQAMGYRGIGIADRNSVAGVVRAYSYAKERLADATDFKVVSGARLVFADGTPDILAYPRDRSAWGRLTRLLTVGNARAEKGSCTLFATDLPAFAAGLQLIVMETSSYEAPTGSGAAVWPQLAAALADADTTVVHFPKTIPSPDHEGPVDPVETSQSDNVLPFRATDIPSRPGEGGIGRMTGGARAARPIRPDAGASSPAPEIGPGEGQSDLSALVRTLRTADARLWLAATVPYGARQRERLARRAALARGLGVPLIATNDAVMHTPDRRPLGDVLTCIRTGTTLDSAGLRLAAHAERHLKSPDEMARMFAGLPEAMAETAAFLDGLAFALSDLAYDYPLELREGFATEQEALAAFAKAGAAGRYPGGVPQTIWHALAHELEAVEAMQYAAYFLTVHDIVRFARDQGILCQGRGSAANSVLCYCLGITEVDPIQTRPLVRALHLRARATSRPTSMSISSTSGARS